MSGIFKTTQRALELLISGDTELWSIVFLSFSVSIKAIFISAPLALIIAFLLNHSSLPGKRIIVTIFNSMLSIPTVVIGLFVYVLLTRQGPFGNLELFIT